MLASHSPGFFILLIWLYIVDASFYVKTFWAKRTYDSKTFLLPAILQGENDTAPSEHVLGPNSGKRSYTLFQGHSGPVHSATFSPLGDFILSSSADTTGIFSWIIISFLSSSACINALLLIVFLLYIFFSE